MDRIKFISIEQLLEKKANKDKFTLVDVHPQDSYQRGHIPGAINLPLDDISSLAARQLNKDDDIVVYCGSYHCQASTMAVEVLQAAGYKRLSDFKAGRRGWESAGLELER